MSFSVVLSRLKIRAKEVGLSEETFFMHELHKISGGGDPAIVEELRDWASSHGYSETAAVIQNLLSSSAKISLSAADIANGTLTVTGSDSITVPVGFLVSDYSVSFVSPSDPSYITCSPSSGDSVSGNLFLFGSAHNLEIQWSVLGTRTVKWIAKK